MNQQTQQNDIPENLSKSSIEKLLNRPISDDYYSLLLKESLYHLINEKEDSNNE